MLGSTGAAGGPNDQAHPPLEAEATGGTTKAQAVSGRVQRLVRLLLLIYRSSVSALFTICSMISSGSLQMKVAFLAFQSKLLI